MAKPRSNRTVVKSNGQPRDRQCHAHEARHAGDTDKDEKRPPFDFIVIPANASTGTRAGTGNKTVGSDDRRQRRRRKPGAVAAGSSSSSSSSSIATLDDEHGETASKPRAFRSLVRTASSFSLPGMSERGLSRARRSLMAKAKTTAAMSRWIHSPCPPQKLESKRRLLADSDESERSRTDRHTDAAAAPPIPPFRSRPAFTSSASFSNQSSTGSTTSSCASIGPLRGSVACMHSQSSIDMTPTMPKRRYCHDQGNHHHHHHHHHHHLHDDERNYDASLRNSNFAMPTRPSSLSKLERLNCWSTSNHSGSARPPCVPAPASAVARREQLKTFNASRSQPLPPRRTRSMTATPLNATSPPLPHPHPQSSSRLTPATATATKALPSKTTLPASRMRTPSFGDAMCCNTSVCSRDAPPSLPSRPNLSQRDARHVDLDDGDSDIDSLQGLEDTASSRGNCNSSEDEDDSRDRKHTYDDDDDDDDDNDGSSLGTEHDIGIISEVMMEPASSTASPSVPTTAAVFASMTAPSASSPVGSGAAVAAAAVSVAPKPSQDRPVSALSRQPGRPDRPAQDSIFHRRPSILVDGCLPPVDGRQRVSVDDFEIPLSVQSPTISKRKAFTFTERNLDDFLHSGTFHGTSSASSSHRTATIVTLVSAAQEIVSQKQQQTSNAHRSYSTRSNTGRTLSVVDQVFDLLQ